MFDIIPQNRPFDACQSFGPDCFLSVTRRMFPELRSRYDGTSGANPPRGPHDIAERMRADPFRQWMHTGHSAQNSEPFMLPVNTGDIAKTHNNAGFDKADIVPSDEFDGALSPASTAWRFPRAMIIARKGE